MVGDWVSRFDGVEWVRCSGLLAVVLFMDRSVFAMMLKMEDEC